MTNPTGIHLVRVVRTASSERYLVQENSNLDIDIAAVEIHYLNNNTVTATIIILVKEFSTDDFIGSLIEKVDSHLLPMACLNDGDLSFTVVEGRFLGQFTNLNDGNDS